MQKINKLIFSNILTTFILIYVCEMGFRIFGVGPYPIKRERPKVEVIPGGKYFEKDSLLGYKPKAGKYKIVLEDEYQFTTEANENHHRITSPFTPHKAISQKPKIWIFGCSITHGWGINDYETFPWVLQSQLPNFEIINWGAGGYGTIHFYLQLKEALKKGLKPTMIILNHADFHFERNVFSNQWRRIYSRWNFLGNINQPHAKLNEEKELEILYSNIEYHPPFLAKYSAFINWCNLSIEAYLDKKNHSNEVKIAKLILDEIRVLCDENQIEILLTNIDGNPDFIEGYSSKNDVPFLDISVDLSKKENTNAPYDFHPNAKINRFFADEIYTILQNDFGIEN